MVLVAAILTLEVLTVAVVVVSKPTGRTPLRGVPWVYLDGFDALLSGFVFDVLVEVTERPQMVPRRLWDVLTDVGQVLEYDMRAVVFDGFDYEFVGNTMQEISKRPSSLRSTPAIASCAARVPHCCRSPRRFSYSRFQWLNSSADQNRPVEATAS